jgi:hypothetical protein
MGTINVAAIGIVDKDLLVLKSLLALAGESKQLGITLVGALEVAELIFLGHLTSAQLGDAVRRHTHHALLVYCCHAGEAPPPGVRVLNHCPPRLAELSKLLAEVVANGPPQETTAPGNDTSSGDAVVAEPLASTPLHLPFVIEHSLAGAIQAKLTKILIDQPLLVSVPGYSPLLVDVRSGVRLVHADRSWFSSQDGWRSSPESCAFEVAASSEALAKCRRYPLRPLTALRFWGIVSASAGRTSIELSRWQEVGLRKMPDFAALPHHDWHPILARHMVSKYATVTYWAHAVRRPYEDVIDFLNAAAAMGWISGKTAR